MVAVDSEIASPAPGTESSSPGSHGPVPPVAGQTRRRWWWLGSVLAAGAAFILGLSIEHAGDHAAAARGLYRMQVLTTVSRFLDEEHRQLAIPVAQRSAPAFGDLANSISGGSRRQRVGHAPGEPGCRQRCAIDADRLLRHGVFAV